VANDHSEHPVNGIAESADELLEEALESSGCFLLCEEDGEPPAKGADDGPRRDGKMGEDIDDNGADWIGEVLPGVARDFWFLQVDYCLDGEFFCLYFQFHGDLGKNELGNKEGVLLRSLFQDEKLILVLSQRLDVCEEDCEVSYKIFLYIYSNAIYH
jgi:hypothetical protein